LGDRTRFTEITDVVVRGDNLIVLDRRESRLVEISARGEPVGEFGREGEGPGEFMSASAIGVADEGDLWVIDYGLRRITFFDPKWQVVRTQSRWPDGVTPYAVLTDSTVLGTTTVGDSRSLVILGLPGFSHIRMLDELDWEHRDLILDHPDGPRWGRFYMRQPFGDWELFGTFADGGIWTVERPAPSRTTPMATVAVFRWDSGGRDLGVSSISFEKIAIPAETITETLAGVAETGYPRLYSQPAFTVAQARERVFLPDHFTPIHEVIPSESGELILKQAGLENRWLRFHPSEGKDGLIDFPNGFQPMVVVGNRVAGRRTDELGVHTLCALHLSSDRPADVVP